MIASFNPSKIYRFHYATLIAPLRQKRSYEKNSDSFTEILEVLEQVKKDRALMNGVVEESLRYDAPKQRNFRRIKKTHQFKGVSLEENEMIFQLIGSANRDERHFQNPDEYRID